MLNHHAQENKGNYMGSGELLHLLAERQSYGVNEKALV